MSDLTAARVATESKISCDDMKHEFPLAVGATVYQGGGVAEDASGNLVRASAATAVKTVGKSCTTKVVSVSGDTAKVEQGIFYFANGSAALTNANRFQPCFWEDDQTVGGDTSGLFAGLVYDVDSGGVWVIMSPQLSDANAAGNQLIAGGAAYTVKNRVDDGATVVTATDNAVITLPDAAAGNKGQILRVQCTAAAGAAKVSISPHSSDKIYGGIYGAATGTLVTFAEALDKDIILTKATALKGDYAELQSDGATGWWVIGGKGVWASEA